MQNLLYSIGVLTPTVLMIVGLLLSLRPGLPLPRLWRAFTLLSAVALVSTLIALATLQPGAALAPWIGTSPIGLVLAVLVQALGTIIASFSARYLQGEAGQGRYVTALAGVLAAVHVLLMADHWVVLIAAWALVGSALQHLLCFYPDRPFALLAAHKKRIADRLADVLLMSAAALAWNEVGSGSLAALWIHLEQHGMSLALQLSAVSLVLAVVLRTALLPVHGWLIQVMEAPTPVSALLHAGVVNLGGFVLIRFAPLLEQAMPARSLLVVLGLATAVLAGLVMLTRISIKVRLAWSTTAQMGFMVLECGLGLYTLAALHLIGHSLYKAHAFLSASMAVRHTRLQTMGGPESPALLSLLFAPVFAIAIVLLIQSGFSAAAWPWWWSTVLGLAWAPLLWLPVTGSGLRTMGLRGGAGVLMIAGLSGATLLAHALPLEIRDRPDTTLGLLALAGMAALYISLVVLQQWPQRLRSWRRWSYAGFYIDEIYTRLALQLWPTAWISTTNQAPSPSVRAVVLPDSVQ